MKLYCMRHGEASADEFGEKKLTSSGRKMVLAAATQMRDKCCNIASIIHSGVQRTQETAAIVSATLDIENVSAAPALLGENAPALPLIDMLPAWETDTLLVGHLPMLMSFMTTLLKLEQTHQQISQFMPATIVCLERVAHDQWLIDWVWTPEVF